MKSTKLKILSIVLCSLSSMAAFAGGDTGWLKVMNINQRSCGVDQGLQISFTTPHSNPDACSNATVVEVPCTLPIYKQVLAIMLTAKTGDLEVSAVVNGCDSEGQAIVTGLRMR